jgi:hypothetical protein
MLVTAVLLGALASPAQAALPAVRVADCRTGKSPEMRLATFEGHMHGPKNVTRMAMRFRLLEQTPGAQDPQAVESPSLAPWRKSRVGVRDFTYAQTIKGLSQGVTYSVSVQFRFYDAKGKIVRREQRDSGTCVQDGDLPNLAIRSVRFAPGSSEKTAVYTVTVANTGEGDAKSLAVTLIADGAHIDTHGVDLLKAGESTSVKFTGPHCSRLRAIVDRAAVVPETVEEDNELRARC